jgi:hypothetical protein
MCKKEKETIETIPREEESSCDSGLGGKWMVFTKFLKNLKLQTCTGI